MRLITYDTENISANQAVYPKFCEGIIFINNGDVDAVLNNIPLPAGSVNDSFDRNFPGDVMQNEFRIAFKSGTLGLNPLVSVVRKFAGAIPKSEECNYNRNK